MSCEKQDNPLVEKEIQNSNNTIVGGSRADCFKEGRNITNDPVWGKYCSNNSICCKRDCTNCCCLWIVEVPPIMIIINGYPGSYPQQFYGSILSETIISNDITGFAFTVDSIP